MPVNGTILFVNCFSEPNPQGANNTAVAVAHALQSDGYVVEMLTVSSDPTWRGPIPDASSPRLAGVPFIRVQREGLKFLVVSPPSIWSDRFMSEKEWKSAVQWGMEMLREIKPILVHQWVWQQVVYFMAASIRLRICTVYSAQDYGLGCQRTFLVNGGEAICDAVIGTSKCSRCVLAGRNWLGRINEWAANLPFTRYLLEKGYGRDGQGPIARRSGVRFPVYTRIDWALKRCREIMEGLDGLTVSSSLGRDLFKQFGIDNTRIFETPFFYDHTELCQKWPSSPVPLVLACVGRIVPYKGIEVLLESLKHIRNDTSVILKIVGVIDSEYGRRLKAQYGEQIGNHQIRWSGWVKSTDMAKFYEDVHAVIVPSTWPETGPRTLIEALAHGRPVVCTDLPSMNTFVRDGENGLLFSVGDIKGLAAQIQHLADSPELVSELAENTRHVPSLSSFSRTVQDVYTLVLEGRTS